MSRIEGAIKAAAARIGVEVDEYKRKRLAGERWCFRCLAWHPSSAFGRDASRADGLARSCRTSRNRSAREGYTPKPGPRPGRRFVAARDGDKAQARGRVNYLVSIGLMESPNARPCADCGHSGDDRRHEYDHHLGYAAEHHEDVEAVCAPCHHAREARRE